MSEIRRVQRVPARPERVKTKGSREQLIQAVRRLGIELETSANSEPRPLQERVQYRHRIREQRRQENLEKIFSRALDYAPAKTGNDELDIDWLSSFISQAQDISSGAMQMLWTKILAAESARPGSFSLKTLTTLKQLTVREADILRRAYALTFRDTRHQSNKIITGYYRKPTMLTWLTLHKPVYLNLARAGLSYPDILALGELGILYPSAMESGELGRSAISLTCGSSNLTLLPKRKGLVITYYKYTAQGEEILRLLPAVQQQAFVEPLQEQLHADFEVISST